jgi:hypothetical protein
MSKFQLKYVGIWYLIGFGMGLVLTIATLIGEGFSQFGSALLITVIGLPLGFIIWGFIGLAIATLNHGFKFNNVMYAKWIWYIYPFYTIYALGFGLAFGVLKVMGLKK